MSASLSLGTVMASTSSADHMACLTRLGAGASAGTGTPVGAGVGAGATDADGPRRAATSRSSLARSQPTLSSQLLPSVSR